jgi:hypothetical protein
LTDVARFPRRSRTLFGGKSTTFSLSTLTLSKTTWTPPSTASRTSFRRSVSALSRTPFGRQFD